MAVADNEIEFGIAGSREFDDGTRAQFKHFAHRHGAFREVDNDGDLQVKELAEFGAQFGKVNLDLSPSECGLGI